MSTVAPDTVRRVGEAVAATGAAFLDAPVSGSVPTVEKGELTIMVGGDAAALERARPVLDALAAKVFHVGALGAGATVKLAVNALVHAIDVGLSEALVLAEKAGVDRSAAYDVFAAGAAAAPFVLYKRPAFEDPDNAPLTFTLDLMAKDLDLILSLAREVGAPMGQAERNREVVERALVGGFSGRDMSAVAEYLRRSGLGSPVREGLVHAGGEVPVLAEVAASPVGLEPEQQAPGKRDLLAFGDHRRPPLDRYTVAVDERPAHRHAGVALLAGDAIPVGADPVMTDVRFLERVRPVARVLGEQREDEVRVSRLPRPPVSLDPVRELHPPSVSAEIVRLRGSEPGGRREGVEPATL